MSDSKQIFISYSSQDVSFVSKLHEDLQKVGFDLWRDKTHIRGIDEWDKTIHDALKTSTVMLLVLSENSMNSKEVYREWHYFLSIDKPLICIWLGDCDIHFRLVPFQRIDFRRETNYSDSLKKLIFELNLLLNETQNSLPVPTNISSQDVDWNYISDIAIHFTAEMLGIRYREKYSQRYYFERPDIQAHLDDFLDNDKRVMVITGRAGTGKSTFVCNFSHLPPNKTIVLLQDCAHLDLEQETSIDQYLTKIFKLRTGFLKTIAELCDENQSIKIVLLFDAVNEFHDRERLLRTLSSFIREISTPCVKVLVTSRIPIWDGIKRHFTVPLDLEFHPSGANSYVNMGNFGSTEAEVAYKLYQKAYNLKSDFDDLSPLTQSFLSQPLFLKLTAEAYAGKELPSDLVLQKVFAEYVLRNLGQEGQDSDEYKVLQRAIQLMYENKKRELHVEVFKDDPAVDRYKHEYKPYENLLDTGLLSQRGVSESMIRQTELVFVTYERVFEFLLAEFTLGRVTASEIVAQLEVARTTSFVQLRGALELALSFLVVKDSSKISLILELSYLERPDSRQFLADVIWIVYETGNMDLAIEIINTLSVDTNQFANLLAVQAAYQLKLDDTLVNLAVSTNPVLNETASVYLYQRWNRARLDGKVQDGYQAIEKLANSIRVTNIPRSSRVIQTLMLLTVNLVSHMVDDPKSLVPLGKILQNMVRKIPGLEPKPDRNAFLSFARERVLDALSQAFAFAAKRALRETILGNPQAMEAFFQDKPTKRALMDSSMFWSEDELIGHKDKLSKLLKWQHDLVAIQIRGPLLYHVYHDVDNNLPIVRDLFHETLEDYEYMQGAVHSAASIIYAVACKAIRDEVVSPETLQDIKDIFFELWYYLDEHPNEKMADVISNESKNVLIGLLTIEAVIQKRDGFVTGSELYVEICTDMNYQLKPARVEVLLNALERFAYQGYPDFAVHTLLKQEVKEAWEKHARPSAIQLLANLRAFYQEEVDSILLGGGTNVDNLWNDVRMKGSLPNSADIFSPSVNWWLVATSVEPMITKLGGVVLMSLASSESFDEALNRILKDLLAALFDYDLIDIGFMQWFKVHDASWDKFEKFKIPRRIEDMNYKQETQEYSKNTIEAYIQDSGRGILFGEL